MTGHSAMAPDAVQCHTGGMESQHRYLVTPTPKPTQTAADRWKQRPPVMRYRAFADRCRELGMTLENGDHVLFLLPMPPSWSAKKRAAHVGQPHTQKPDTDNLCKAFGDAVLKEDEGLWCVSLEKRWGETGEIVVTRKIRTAIA